MKVVLQRRGLRILVIAPEGYGGFGGISVYNADFCNALACLPAVEAVTVLPRLIRQQAGKLPDKVTMVASAAKGRIHFIGAAVRQISQAYDMIICTHVHLLPFAFLLRALHLRRVPLLCIIYGIDAWQPTGRPLVDHLSKRCDAYISISDCTADRFVEWSGVDRDRVNLLANCFHAEQYGIGSKPKYLLERYGLTGHPTIMTFGRLVSMERQKGVDELLSIMPRLLRTNPSIRCLVVGDGDDRPRLEQKAGALGIRKQVVFAGRVSEAEKADHYRLADVFSLVGRQEGFGFVVLEAMACGIPVVGSSVDGSREAVLNGELGELADPGDLASIETAIHRAFARPRQIPPRLDHFSYSNFVRRLDAIITQITKRCAASPRSKVKPL